MYGSVMGQIVNTKLYDHVIGQLNGGNKITKRGQTQIYTFSSAPFCKKNINAVFLVFSFIFILLLIWFKYFTFDSFFLQMTIYLYF